MPCPVWIACSLVVLPGVLPDAVADRKALLDGIEVLERRGVPGTLSVFGDDAFAVLTCNRVPEPVVAAARHGKGRVVALAHDAYLTAGSFGDEAAASARLFANALRWSAARDGPVKVGILGSDPALATHVRAAGHTVRDGLGPASSSGQDVLVWRRGVGSDAAEHEALRAFVHGGGGLLVAACPWGYEQVNQRRGLTVRDDLPQNAVLRPMGLVFARGYANATGPGGFAKSEATAAAAHAGAALEALVAKEPAAGARAHLLVKALRSLPPDNTTFLPHLLDRIGPFDAASAPRARTPLRSEDGLARLQATWQAEAWKELPPEDVTALPGVDTFPGAVPAKATRVTVKLSPDPAILGWQGTGLYLAAGDVLSVKSNADAEGWRVRIGCHTDRLWAKDAWQRWPEISHAVDLTGALTAVATPYGGTVYFERTRDGAPARTFTVAGAVAAPRYVLGDAASARDWKQSRKAPAPWCEIEGRNMVLSVPSDAIRDWNDPGPLIAWWDAVLASHCRLAGTPVPRRRERFVADVQISAGYMHSGYPIMTHMDVVRAKRGRRLPPLLDLETLSNDGTWGLFHELGHNRQKPAWTFAGTTEVTCNLFSLYTNHSLCGIEPWENDWLVKQRKGAREHLANGAPFAAWKRKPGVALMMYAQVQRAFGWKPFERVLAAYERIPAATLPRTDQQKIDQWMTRLSHAVDRDLRPFFRKWGLPLGPGTKSDASLDRLEPWMPRFDDL